MTLNAIRYLLLPVLLLITAGTTHAADGCGRIFAGKNLRWIVPFAAGGSYDVYSRIVGARYAERLGANVRVENRPGAGGRIGAEQISRAAPDGTTLGTVSGTGLVALLLSEETDVPDLLRDFTVLGRVDRSHHVWATAADSKWQSIDQVLGSPAKKIVFGTPGVGSISFASIVLTSHILGVEAAYVTGYKNSRATRLGAVRGEVDLISHSYETMRKDIASGKLRALLQLSHGPIGNDTALANVPWLGGADGVAVKYGVKRGQSSADIAADVDAVLALGEIGRVVVAPPGIAGATMQCMRSTLMSTLADREVYEKLSKLGRDVNAAPADLVVRQFNNVAARRDRLKPVMAAAIANLRR